MAQHPGSLDDFYATMSFFGEHNAHWTTWFPMQSIIIDGANATGPLLVDVGGGDGTHIEKFLKLFPQTQGRLILQDLPRVVESSKLSTGIEAMAHDFFEPQPIKGMVGMSVQRNN
jgi:hypothetical protein